MNLLAAIPSHPLFVHVPVVLVPLAAIGAIAIAVRPRWMAAYGYPVAGLAGVGFVGALIAAHTGEELEESYQAAGPFPDSCTTMASSARPQSRSHSSSSCWPQRGWPAPGGFGGEPR